MFTHQKRETRLHLRGAAFCIHPNKGPQYKPWQVDTRDRTLLDSQLKQEECSEVVQLWNQETV